MDEEDDDDEGEEDVFAEEEVSLGFARPPEDPGALLRNRFPSKLGGKPAWLDPVQLPLESDELRCGASGEPMRFLLQLYAPLDDGEDTRAFHRMLYVFVSSKGSRLAERGAVEAYSAPRAATRPALESYGRCDGSCACYGCYIMAIMVTASSLKCFCVS